MFALVTVADGLCHRFSLSVCEAGQGGGVVRRRGGRTGGRIHRGQAWALESGCDLGQVAFSLSLGVLLNGFAARI